MIFSRSKPGFAVSATVHAGLLLAALVLFADTRKFEEAQEALSVEVVSNSQLNQIMKGEKTAHEVKTAPRAEKIAEKTETRPHPALAEAKKDTPAPPPPLKRTAEPSQDDEPPTPPKRAAALPTAPPAGQPPEPVKAEPRPTPAPPVKPQAKAAPEPEKDEPQEAEIVKPKPPQREKPKETAKETPTEKPKPVAKPKQDRLKIDEVAKLLEQKKLDHSDKANDAQPDKTQPTSAKAAKPKSGEENSPKSKFNASSIANLLSREAPQQQASTASERTQLASLGAPDANASQLSASMQARIGAYIIDHYRPCWAASLSLGVRSYQPIVEFHLSREGGLIGAPRLVNPTSDPVDKARAEQALHAVRQCSPIHMPADFAPFYDFWRDTKLRMTEEM